MEKGFIVGLLMNKYHTNKHNKHNKYLSVIRRFIWYPKTKFWSEGFFTCTTGDASEETIKKYI